MQNQAITPGHLSSAFLAIAAVVAANLLAQEAGPTAIDQVGGVDATEMHEVRLPDAPAPLTGITGPVGIRKIDFEDAKLLVPELRRPTVALPAIRRVESPLARGVMPAPTSTIEVAPPSTVVDDGELEVPLEVPVLERPVLAPPPVR